MRCEEAKEINESHSRTLSPPISLSWVLEGNPRVRKLLGSLPLCLSIPHRVLSLLLIWAAELSSHNTKNLTVPQTSKCFLGKNTSTVLWAFPAAKLQEPCLSFFPLWFISLRSTTGNFFFFFACDSMMIHFFAISYYFPCHLFSWSAAYLPPPIIS